MKNDRATYFKIDEIIDLWPDYATLIREALKREA